MTRAQKKQAKRARRNTPAAKAKRLAASKRKATDARIRFESISAFDVALTMGERR